MKAAPIFVILAAGSALGWFSPDIADTGGTFSAESGGEVAGAHEQDRLDVVRQQQWYAGNVVLPRANDGHFYADVTVDGATRNMLVDTGASVIALTGADAAAMGIQWDEAAVRQIGSGASGAVYGVPVTLANVQLGRLKASGVEAVVVPKGLGVSLLGQSFLSQIDKVEIDQDKMVLGG